MDTTQSSVRACVVAMFDRWVKENAVVSLEFPPMDLGEDSVRQNAFKLIASVGSGVFYWNEIHGDMFLRELVRNLSFWKRAATRDDLDELAFANDLLRHWALQLLLRKETSPRELAEIIDVPEQMDVIGSPWSAIAEEFATLTKERFRIRW